MITVEESIITTMDGSEKDILPFITYIMQDLWEIGANPESIIKLIEKNFTDCSKIEVLDLGCGKGAVSVKAAKSLRCRCHGIDAIPEFIEYARKKAIEYEVEHLCKFETGDIRERVFCMTGYDVIVLGAIRPVFGDYLKTLTTLENCLKRTGIFVIDDGYIKDDCDYSHPLIQKHKDIIKQVELAEMEISEENVFTRKVIINSNDNIYECIKKRCSELINKHPDKKELFENYIKKQREENNVLENHTVCSTIVIKKK